MDYDDKFYRDLVPPSETHKHLVIWSYMVNLNGRPRYGRSPAPTDSPLHAIAYSSIYSSLMAVKMVDLAEMADQAARDEMERAAVRAGKVTDTAANIGSALLTLEETLKENDEPVIHIQLQRTTGGRWIVNNSIHGDTLDDAVAKYVVKRLSKFPPKGKERPST